MNRAVIHDKDTPWSRIWIHVLKQSIQKLQEVFTIPAANLDVTEYDTLCGQGR
jgi:hypothetical protein